MEQTDTQAEAQEFKNDLVSLTVQKKPDCRVEYTVEVFPGLVREAHKKSIKAIAKEVALPGFRKGRAPDQLVLKNFPQQVDKQWQDMLATDAFRECQKLTRIPLINPEAKVNYKMESHSQEGAKLTLSFETEPVLPTIDPQSIQIKSVKRPEVNEEKVEETIRQTRLFFAEWKQITDRPVQPDDYVMLDVDVIEENPPRNLFSNTRFEVTEKSMAEWMRNLVIGLSTGESAEGMSVPDEDASEEDKETLTPKKVRLTVKAIESADMPPLDDDFAQKLGVRTVDEMRASITRLLNQQADAHVQEKMREQVGEYLLTHYTFDLPPSLIEKETHFRFKQLLQDAQFQDYWNRLGGDERRKIIESVYEQSKKAVWMFYLCRKVITDAHISVSPQDIAKFPTTPLEALISPSPAMQRNQQPEIQQAEAFSRVMLEKAEDYLISRATII